MLFLLMVFILTYACFFLHERRNNLATLNITVPIICSAVIATSLWMVATIFVYTFVAPSTRIIDNTTTLLRVNLNDGKVALGYEIAPSNKEGKWYVYKDEQDEGAKYLFIELTDSRIDFGINAKLVDADECEIRYIGDEESCRAEYYHMEYDGFARTIAKNGGDGITLYIHENSMEEIWFPYSN